MRQISIQLLFVSPVFQWTEKGLLESFRHQRSADIFVFRVPDVSCMSRTL
jgi:hypothetical protein